MQFRGEKMILDEIAIKTRERISEEKKKVSLEEIKKLANSMKVNNDFPFEKALKKEGISFICEVKKASPSKGIIAEDFPYIEIAKEYEVAGAAAISVLTEPTYFKGSNEYLKEIKEQVKIPVLRKDFTIEEYMIYEAKVMGADAILLICSLLNDEELKDYLNLAHKLGISALVEAHDEEEVCRALRAGSRSIGVNNRDLKTFSVDIQNSIRLRKLVPKDVIFVSESGMKTPEDIARLIENGTDAVLIGETLMKSQDKQNMLASLKGESV